MPHSPVDYLRHILEEANYLVGDSRAISKDQFLEDETRKRAYARSIEIIGEAAKKLSDDVRDRAPQIEWSRMAGMRDRVIHDYFGVDYDIVWLVAIQKAPELVSVLPPIIEALEEADG